MANGEAERGAARWSILLAGAMAAGLAFLGAVARQRDIPRYRTVWAEDGALFGQCPLVDPFPPACVAMPYDGWLHLVPRLLGWAAASGPPEWFSYSVTALAGLTAAACAFLVARAVAEATGSRIAGAVAGAALTLVFPAGVEVAGNVTNLSWIMFGAAAAVLACALLGRSLGRLDAALVLLTTASSPFGLLLVGLLAMERPFTTGGRPRSSALLFATSILALVQLGMAFVSPRNQLPDVHVAIFTPVGWFLELAFVRGPFGRAGLVPGPVIGVLAGGVLVALFWLAWHERGGGPRPWGAPLALFSVSASYAAVFIASTSLNRHVAPRYDFVPAAGMIIVLICGVALLASRLAARVSLGPVRITGPTMTTAAVALIVALGFGSTFQVTTRASRGPSFPGELSRARAACEIGGPVAVVRLSPLPRGDVTTLWEMRIPCARLVD